MSVGLLLLTACPSAPTPTPTKADPKPATSESAPASQPEPAPNQADPPIEFEPRGQPGTPPLEGGASELDADPSWFAPTKVDHAKILQARNQAKVGKSTATAMLLELQPGTTTEDCVSAVRTEMTKSITDLAEAKPGDKGRMTMQGKTESYSYTVVCGPGKDGQTTLYLSYMGL